MKRLYCKFEKVGELAVGAVLLLILLVRVADVRGNVEGEVKPHLALAAKVEERLVAVHVHHV